MKDINTHSGDTAKSGPSGRRELHAGTISKSSLTGSIISGAHVSGKDPEQGTLTPSGQSKCKRCGRYFQPKKEGQEYGEKCLRKMAGQTVLSSRFVVPPRRKKA